MNRLFQVADKQEAPVFLTLKFYEDLTKIVIIFDAHAPIFTIFLFTETCKITKITSRSPKKSAIGDKIS